MDAIAGKVMQPLSFAESGLSYMIVNTERGPVTVLPSPSYSGIVAQATMQKGIDAYVAEAGVTGRTRWGVLLNSSKQQYGCAMDYANLGTVPQVFYIGDSSQFPRMPHRQSSKQRNDTVADVRIFGTQVAVDFSNLGEVANYEDFSAFQGYIVSVPRENAYMTWFALTRENFLAAGQDNDFMGIRQMIGSKVFSFIGANEHFDPKALEARIAQASPPAPAAQPAPKAKVLYNAAGAAASVMYSPGNYTIDGLVGMAARITNPPAKLAKVLEAVAAHVAGNNPVMLYLPGSQEGALVQKTQKVALASGKEYRIETQASVKPAASQPVIQPRPETMAQPGPEHVQPSAPPAPPQQPAQRASPAPQPATRAAPASPPAAPAQQHIEHEHPAEPAHNVPDTPEKRAGVTQSYRRGASGG